MIDDEEELIQKLENNQAEHDADEENGLVVPLLNQPSSFDEKLIQERETEVTREEDK